jgi:hypothetical protein
LHDDARMRIHRLASSLLAALVLTATAVAPSLVRADEPASAPAVAVAPAAAAVDQVETVWYGYQNLGADAVALGLGIAAVDTYNRPSDVLAWSAVGVYALGGPLVHVLHHGLTTRSLASVAMRLGLPVAGAYLGMALVHCNHQERECEGDDLGGYFIGAGLGIATAVIVDDFFLAREERHVERSPWTPTVAPAPGGGMTFGVAATF